MCILREGGTAQRKQENYYVAMGRASRTRKEGTPFLRYRAMSVHAAPGDLYQTIDWILTRSKVNVATRRVTPVRSGQVE